MLLYVPETKETLKYFFSAESIFDRRIQSVHSVKEDSIRNSCECHQNKSGQLANFGPEQI